jgi:hypothetical protein
MKPDLPPRRGGKGNRGGKNTKDDHKGMLEQRKDSKKGKFLELPASDAKSKLLLDSPESPSEI